MTIVAKFEKHLIGNFDEFLQRISDSVLNGSMSASYEDGSDWTSGEVRCAVRVFERYSAMGGNRVSMNVTLVGKGEELFLTAITSGGSQAVFFKLNTLGEESFLEKLVPIVENYKKRVEGGVESEEMGGSGRAERKKPPLLHLRSSLFFHSKTGVRSGKGCPLCRLRSLKRVLTVYRELWYDFIMIK